MATEPAGKLLYFTWWDQVPENLKTKTQLDAVHLKPGGPVRAQIEYGRGRKHRIYDLYQVDEAIAKVATPAQLAALEQARIAQRTCTKCGRVVEKPSDLGKRTGRCIECRVQAAEAKRAREVDATITWARTMLASDALILDTETTDLHGRICEIGIISMDGSIVVDTLVNPQTSNQATHIHGISDRMTWSAPTFADIEPQLRQLLHGRTVVVYNAEYDAGVLECEMKRLCTPSDDALVWLEEWETRHAWDGSEYWVRPTSGAWWQHQYLILEQATWWRERINWQCAMLEYSCFVGDYHEYYRDYKYQALGGGHRAVGDCRACLQVLRRMAETPLSTEPPRKVLSDQVLDDKIDAELYAMKLEQDGRHPDDDPEQWQKVT